MFDLILFDLDGTLVDTAPEIADSVNDVLRQNHLTALDDARIRDWIGHGARELMRQAYAQAAGVAVDTVTDDTMRELMRDFAYAHEARCGTRSRVYPGTLATLSALQRRGLRMAVITNKEGRFAEAVLQAHGLRAFFDPVVAGDTLDVRKPDPQVVRHCLAVHGVTAARTLLVGDSAIDVATGRAAGITCWVVPHGYNGGKSIESAEPDRVLPHLGALLEALDQTDLTTHASRRIGGERFC